MNKATSLYLDLARFTAAFVVFRTHLSSQVLAGGFLWQIADGGRMAVSVFFVLSGYVIAHVLKTRENSLLAFAASRFGRLYSVVLPALALTFLCDWMGLAKDPQLYLAHDSVRLFDDVPARYFATAALVNRFWALTGWGTVANLEPGTNGPFWSLSFEFSYYVAIAILVFGRGWIRMVMLALLCLVAGPAILVLAPAWFLGFGIYHWQDRIRLSVWVSAVLWIVSIAACLASSKIQYVSLPSSYPFLDPVGQSTPALSGLLCRYASAITFGMNLIAVRGLSEKLEPLLSPFSGAIRWLGSLTFALYLFHRPLLVVLTAYRIGPAQSLVQSLWVIGGTLLIVATLGHFCETSKSAYKKGFLAAAGMIGGWTREWVPQRASQRDDRQ